MGHIQWIGDSIVFSVNCQNYLDGASCVDSNTGAVVYSTSYSHNFALEDSAHIIFGGEKILRDTRAWENLDNCLERSVLTLGVGLCGYSMETEDARLGALRTTTYPYEITNEDYANAVLIGE